MKASRTCLPFSHRNIVLVVLPFEEPSPTQILSEKFYSWRGRDEGCTSTPQGISRTPHMIDRYSTSISSHVCRYILLAPIITLPVPFLMKYTEIWTPPPPQPKKKGKERHPPFIQKLQLPFSLPCWTSAQGKLRNLIWPRSRSMAANGVVQGGSTERVTTGVRGIKIG